MVSSSYPRPRRGGVGVGAIGKTSSSSQPLSLRDVEREVEDVFETHSVAEIREVRLVNRYGIELIGFLCFASCLFPPLRSFFCAASVAQWIHLDLSIVAATSESSERSSRVANGTRLLDAPHHGREKTMSNLFPFFSQPLHSKNRTFFPPRSRPRPAQRSTRPSAPSVLSWETPTVTCWPRRTPSRQ